MNKKFTPKYDNDLIPLWYFKQENDTQTRNIDNKLNDEVDNLDEKINNEKIISGSNTNGNWIKYPDGTMICYKSVTDEVSFTTAWYDLYSGTLDLGDFPQEFVDVPHVQLTNSSISAAIVQNFVLLPSKTYPGSIFLTRPFSSESDVTIEVMAIGKWK